MIAALPHDTLDRLAAHLREAGRRYPKAWRQLDEFRARRGEIGDWPAWCFCPLAGAYAIVCDQHGIQDLVEFANAGSYTGNDLLDAVKPSLDVGRVGALGAWRVSQGVYAIDPDVLDAVLTTPVDGAIPIDILLQLPEWCIYVVTSGHTVAGNECRGFFAHLEHDANRGHTELRLLVDRDDYPPWAALGPEILHLHQGDTLAGCYDRMLDAMAREARKAGLDGPAIEAAREVLRATARERLGPLIAILLYLCSQTAEYRGSGETTFRRPYHPQGKKTRDGWRLFPPPRPRVWYVGERIGQAIRDAGIGRERPTEGRAGPRPHVRAAHWHTYWHGSRKAGTRTPVLKWLPPIPVAMAEDTPEARMRHARPGRITNLDTETQTLNEEFQRRHTDGEPAGDAP